MERIVENHWRPVGPGLERAEILAAADTPEGFAVARLRGDAGELALPAEVGHLLSVTAGEVRLDPDGLTLDAGSHVYVPEGHGARLTFSSGAHAVLVSAEAPGQAARATLAVRHERFLCACAVDGQALRWILTPQYLSRRVFLHHDAPLRSREGRPVSWFRTTMFDVSGLPPNEDGESVFRMSYDTRTEFNVCYDVAGRARVRLARHPYVTEGQAWSPWLRLHSDATYHLDEAAGGPEEETYRDAAGVQRTLRNRHEVAIEGGHCSLFCLFDPAPTGVERHRPGAYSDYEAYEDVRRRPEHARHLEVIHDFDEMVESLSLARARGALDAARGGPAWARYEAGLRAQRAIEAALAEALAEEGAGRDRVVEPWRVPADSSLHLP